MKISEITEGDVRDTNLSQEKMKNHFALIKQVYCYLQGKSRTYPFVDTFCFYQYFIKPSGVTEAGIKRVHIEVIIKEAKFDSRGDDMLAPKGSLALF